MAVGKPRVKTRDLSILWKLYGQEKNSRTNGDFITSALRAQLCTWEHLYMSICHMTYACFSYHTVIVLQLVWRTACPCFEDMPLAFNVRNSKLKWKLHDSPLRVHCRRHQWFLLMVCLDRFQWVLLSKHWTTRPATKPWWQASLQ